MVSKVVRFFNKELSSMHQAALLLGTATFLSQILGLVRDRLLTTRIGAGAELDIYYAAFPIPDFIFIAVSSLVSATVLLPLLSAREKNQSETEIRKFLGSISFGFGILLFVVSILAFICTPWLVHLVAPGFDAQQIKLLIPVTRIMLLSPILLGLSNLFSSVTQLYRKFYLSAIAPIFYNVGIIIGITLLYPIFGVAGLGIGVVIGSLLHMAVQIPALVEKRFVPIFSSPKFSEMKEVVRVSIPRTIGLALQNISFLVLISIASLVGEGSISIFRLAYNLQNVPLGIIGMAYSVAAFPTLARLYTEKNVDAFVQQITSATKQILFWALPVTVLFVVLRAQIVRVILGSKMFTWDDTRLAAAVLAMFVISIAAQSLIHLFVRGFYATGDTKTPVRINIIAAVTTLTLGVVFLNIYNTVPAIQASFDSILRIEGVVGGQIALLAFAYTCGALVNACILWKYFRARFFPESQYFVGRALVHSLVSSLGIGIVAYIGLQFFATIFSQETFWGIFAQGFVSGMLGLIVGFVMLRLMKSAELENIVSAIRGKFWKQKETPAIPEQQVL